MRAATFSAGVTRNKDSASLWGRMLVAGLLVVYLSTGGLCQHMQHIVVILADDLGWNDVGFHGSDQIPTPNIDALAYSGVILNRHYTLPACTPSRTAYLTGRYPIRSGMQGYPLRAGEPRGLPLGETLLPQRLHQLGYVTRLVGKWHLGSHESRYLPTRRGFASHLGHWHGYMGYHDHELEQNTSVHNQVMRGLDLHRGLRTARELVGQYATEVYTREACSIIRSHNTSRPLYLQLAHLAVHAGNSGLPLEVPDVRANDRRFQHIRDPSRRLYAGMVAALDESVGAVVAALASNHMLNDSLLVFLSDNGAQTHGLHANAGSNWPLRGLKMTLLEGGVRTVCALWSSRLSDPGSVFSQLVHVTDWLPTLVAAAGGSVSELGELDGVDQWAAISEPGVPTPRRDELLVNIDEAAGTEALIRGRWKLLHGSYRGGVYDQRCGESGREQEGPGYDVEGVLRSAVATELSSLRPGPGLSRDQVLRLRAQATVTCGQLPAGPAEPPCNHTCLFDLEADPCEGSNLAAHRPHTVAELEERLEWFRQLAVPQLNMPLDLSCDPALHNGSWVPWLDPESAGPI